MIRKSFWSLMAVGLMLTSCNDIENLYRGPEETDVKKEDFFEFSTEAMCGMSLSYDLPVVMTFHLYDEYPYELVGNTWEKKEGLNALYAGFTDEKGNFSADVILPAYVKKAWLVTDNVLVESPIEVEINSVGGLNFDYTQYREAAKRGKTRATDMGNGVLCPDGYDRLGEWDSIGTPYYLLTEKVELPSAFLKRCNGLSKTTEVQQPLLERFPELTTTGTNDMVLVKSTELIATYFKSSAGWSDMVAYYTFQEGENIDVNSIRKTILFPHYNENTESLIGSQVKLRYWNNESQSYQDEFPAGTRIGWVLLAYHGKDQWNLADSPNVLRYSNPAYNTGNQNGKQHSILLMDNELDDNFFMIMEDNSDMRFNDVQFAITSAEPGAVEPTPIIPGEVGKDEEVSYTVYGTLAYEDNWPSKGDYDMNDVMVNFEGTVVKKEDAVVRTTTTFTAVHDGADFTNGFGIQFDNITASKVEALTVSRGGEIIHESFEEGAERPTLLLYSNNKQVLNKKTTVELRFSQYSKVAENDIRPPYNPFIFVNKREREVHLPSYIPTSKLDESLRGTESDLEMDDYGNAMYYISKDNMPFALYVSGRYLNIEEMKEEGRSILDVYPAFKDWRDSSGEYNQDWYVTK